MPIRELGRALTREEAWYGAARGGRGYYVSTNISVGLGLFWALSFKNTGSRILVLDRVICNFNVDGPVTVSMIREPTTNLPTTTPRTVGGWGASQASSGLEFRTEALAAQMGGGTEDGGFVLAGSHADNDMEVSWRLRPNELLGGWVQYAAAATVGLTIFFHLE